MRYKSLYKNSLNPHVINKIFIVLLLIIILYLLLYKFTHLLVSFFSINLNAHFVS